MSEGLVAMRTHLELWQLNTIGIRDSEDSQSEKELEEEAKSHFLQNIKRHYEGHKECSIMCVNSEEKLNKLIVESQAILEKGKFKLQGERERAHSNLPRGTCEKLKDCFCVRIELEIPQPSIQNPFLAVTSFRLSVEFSTRLTLPAL
ncbi:hypothetical protein NPIL_119971 [Nephila pilipes]|uniref:Uncharacterized protein n=1 Tax=Nephila pilipes TaxID=299642 RepID=A0A8X6Q4F1_NEPPI|nr:hypothetical protein NPIL_119971 [Nephila pilipes]